MDLPNICLQAGILMVYGTSLDADFHKHNAIQIIWPTDKAHCKFIHHEAHGSIIINSDVTHQLTMNAGWIILIEPQSNLGQMLNELLKDNANNSSLEFKEISTTQLKAARSPIERSFDSKNIEKILHPLFIALHLDIDAISINRSASLSDQRIQALLNELDACFISDCLKPSHWAASEVAQQLSLSESRFLHLFRQQMGIAWRPYLLWRRMTCAISAMLKGHSATKAAYIAGFSDSAHLSRTFRSNFGMSIRYAQKLFKDLT